MTSKFRQDKVKRNYTVRTFLRRILGCGMVSLLSITCIATLIAFYLMIWYQVEQSIEMGFMMNLNILSQTMSML